MTLSSPPNETSPSPTSNASGSILREYTSPTCKLQISANPSALEKWTRKPTLKNQRFLLSLEDPRLSEDQWVNLRGDRLKLAALTEAVTTYVQGFLSQSRSIAQPYNQIELTESPTAEVSTFTQGISIQPKGLLAHTLKLGTIATEATGDSLSLTSTQLADLASVLDEHGSATLDLPALNRDTAWMRSPTAWGKIAAFSLLSVGITASVLNQFSPKQTPIQIASQASSSDQRITPPQVPQPTPTPSVFVSPSNKLPGQPAPTPGSTTPPIAVDSNTSNPTTQDRAKTDPAKTEKTDTTEKTGAETVESTGKAAPKKEVTSQNGQSADKLSGTVQPVPVASQRKASPSSSDTARARAEAPSADQDPEPPALMDQIEAIQAKIAQKWSPPEKTSDELTYIIEIAPDGKINNVNPEGKASPAAEAILPSKGTTIAPAIPSTNSPYKVRVFFYPDGTVSVKKA
jgi:Domain of unknown function (DUF4335)